MATVINNPGSDAGNGGGNGGGSGVILGIVLAIVILGLLYLFAWPNMRGTAPAPAQQSAPEADSGTTVEVPDQIDVNVKQ